MTHQEDSVESSVPEPSRRSWPRRMINRIEVDRAVFYALMLRGWQLAGGLVSVLLIAVYFKPEVQGYYYTFYHLMALQAFFELGFSGVVVNIVSHEWAHLELDESRVVTGDLRAMSRMSSLVRLLFRWYGVAAVLFIILVGFGGSVFLNLQPDEGIAWQTPWIALVMLSGLLLWMLPFNSVLEGCNQVASVNRFRVVQAVTTNIVIWISLVAGAGLWVAVAGTAMRVAVEMYFLLFRNRNFFQSLQATSFTESIQWREEIWHLQWRRAVTGMTGYFAFSLFVPVMLHYHGSITSGRMGMTWALVTTLQAAALSWIQTRIPRFGELIARQEYGELDRIFKRLTFISLGVISTGSIALWGLVYGINLLELKIASRLLPPLPMAILLLAVTAFQIPHCMDAYIRSHKRDPLLPIYITGNLVIGFLVWFLGMYYGPTGASLGYLCGVIMVFFPGMTFVWRQSRRQWH